MGLNDLLYMKSMKYGEHKYNVGVGYYVVTPLKMQKNGMRNWNLLQIEIYFKPEMTEFTLTSLSFPQ